MILITAPYYLVTLVNLVKPIFFFIEYSFALRKHLGAGQESSNQPLKRALLGEAHGSYFLPILLWDGPQLAQAPILYNNTYISEEM